MNIFLPEHQDCLSKLLEHKVEFLLIGGYAVIFHGYGRTTGDMDLWVKPTNTNRDRLVQAFISLGFEIEELRVLSNQDFTKHTSFSWESEPKKIDFITHINQVTFEEADQNKIIYEWEGLQIPVINMRELILSKINTGRKKDEADIEELQKIVNRNKE